MLCLGKEEHTFIKRFRFFYMFDIIVKQNVRDAMQKILIITETSSYKSNPRFAPNI